MDRGVDGEDASDWEEDEPISLVDEDDDAKEEMGLVPDSTRLLPSAALAEDFVAVVLTFAAGAAAANAALSAASLA